MSVRKFNTTEDATRVYAYIVAFISDNGYPPRPRDIRDDLGITAHQLDFALVRLRGAGRIGEHSTLPTVTRDPLAPAA